MAKYRMIRWFEGLEVFVWLEDCSGSQSNKYSDKKDMDEVHLMFAVVTIFYLPHTPVVVVVAASVIQLVVR